MQCLVEVSQRISLKKKKKNIYIYIYIERERERENKILTLPAPPREGLQKNSIDALGGRPILFASFLQQQLQVDHL